MITLNRVSFKLLAYVILSFAAAAAGVLLTADYRIEEIINQNQTTLYRERLNTVANVLSYHLGRLRETGWQEAYEEDFQDAALKGLRSTYYGTSVKLGYPLIFDGEGAIVMHPELANGSPAMKDSPCVRKMLKEEEGSFDITDKNGKKQWVIFQHFSDWNWTLAYIIPFDLKYHQAKRLNQDLILIIIIIVCLVVTILSLLLRKMISPVEQLTQAASSLAAGKDDVPIEVKSGDEFGTLASSFIRMRRTIREKILELATKNKEISESEERFRQLIDQAADAVFVHDFEGKILTVNQQACESLGYSKDELLNMHVADIEVSHSHQDTINELWDRLHHENKVTSEGLHKKKDGTSFPVELRTGILSANNQKYILTLARDITSRKEAEIRLQQSEEKLRLVIEKSPIAMAVTTPNGMVTSINKKFKELFGYTEKDIASLEDWYPKAYPDHLDRDTIGRKWLARIESYLKTGVFKVITAEVQCKDNAKKDIEFNFAAVGEQHITSFIDVSERNRARDELISEKDFSEHIINSMPGIFFVYQQVGKNFLLKRWNKNHEVTLGYTKDDLKDAQAETFISTEQRQNIKRILAELVKRGSIETEIQVLKKDGTHAPFYGLAQMFSRGNVNYFMGSCIDISELKQAEEDRRKLQKQLIQAQKMEAIGTLAGGIAHDFNNILSAIIGYTELSQMETAKESKVAGYLANLMNAGNRARDLVQQILTFSRQTKHEVKPVLVSAIAKEVLKLLSATLPSSIEIRHNIDSSSLVMGDPIHIHQILMNLCTNAGHAMAEGGVLHVELTTIELDNDTISQFPDLTPGPHISLTVDDTGHGMSAEILERIFDPFYTTKEKGEGTGMGLAVVHGIVKSYGGTIYAYSEPGQGSSFKLYLPVIEGDEAAAKTVEYGKSFPTGSEKILLVDDEPDIVVIGKQMLENLGYTVTGVTSSIEALALFEEKSEDYHIVITDMTMPKLQGEKLAEKILSIRPGLPIILCTGFSHRVSKEKLKDLGFAGILMKPIIRLELANLVRDVLDKSYSSND